MNSREAVTLESLLGCSDSLLQSILLARMNQAATLRKQMAEMAEEMNAALLEADLCRFVIEHRSDIGRPHAVQIPLDLRGGEVAPLVRRPAPKKGVDAKRKNAAVNAA